MRPRSSSASYEHRAALDDGPPRGSRQSRAWRMPGGAGQLETGARRARQCAARASSAADRRPPEGRFERVCAAARELCAWRARRSGEDAVFAAQLRHARARRSSEGQCCSSVASRLGEPQRVNYPGLCLDRGSCPSPIDRAGGWRRALRVSGSRHPGVPARHRWRSRKPPLPCGVPSAPVPPLPARRLRISRRASARNRDAS